MKFALAGNPNSGKTTLFNALTGSTAHVGNWPGVTVEQRTGLYKKLAEPVEIVDLPGIYSLSPYTPEETISRAFLLEEAPDCIINVVDATNLERNLYLTTQILELDAPVIVALNMCDVAAKNGDRIDLEKLEKALGVPVAEISALRGSGVRELMRRAYEAAGKARACVSPVAAARGYRDCVAAVRDACVQEGLAQPLFTAVKLIEGDALETARLPGLAALAARLRPAAEGIFEGDYEGVVADLRYRFIDAECAVLTRGKTAGRRSSPSDRADRVLTHRIWGIPVFLLMMFAIFHLTFSENLLFLGAAIREGTFDLPIVGTDAIHAPGVMLQSCVEWLTGLIRESLAGAMPAGAWYTSLVLDGIWAGVSAVLSFIPQIMLLFLFLSVLEDSGYMARVAFIMDRAFRRFGLSGKAFLPLLMCFGCAVPGIMATRTLENADERRRTIRLAPFFSCGAKLPIWAAFAGVFAHYYANMNAELIVYTMYVLGIATAIVSALIMHKLKKGQTPPFLMELPAYHAPRLGNLAARLWTKLRHYLVRAATIIAASTVVVWFLSSFSFDWKMVEDNGDSILGGLGKLIAPVFVPLGFGMGADGWKFVVAALTGLLAKEMVVSTMGVFAGMDGDAAVEGDPSELWGLPIGSLIIGVGGTLGGVNVSIPAMFSFMAFNLLSVPCMAAVAAAAGEFHSRRELWGAIGFWMLTAYLTSLFLFWYGVLWAWSWGAGLGVTLSAAAVGVVAIVLTAKRAVKRRAAGTGTPPADASGGTVAPGIAEASDDEPAKKISIGDCGSCESCPCALRCGRVRRRGGKKK